MPTATEPKMGKNAAAVAVLLVLRLDVALFSPHLLLQAFNPLSTNLAALALCAVAWLAEAPSAADS